jgi:hypothetical protein
MAELAFLPRVLVARTDYGGAFYFDRCRAAGLHEPPAPLRGRASGHEQRPCRNREGS